MALQFGRSDSGRSVDIGHEVRTRMWVSLQLALPLFILQLIVSIGFSLLLVFFRHSRIDFWGVVLCVVMLSISSLFYIIVGQFLFSRVLHLVPISGYAGGLDAVRFLLLPIFLSLLSRLGSEARLYRAMFLEEIGKDYVRTARAKGLSELRVLFRHVLRNALIPIITSAGSYLPYVFLGSLVFESFFGIPGLGAFVIEAISGQDFAIVRSMVFLGARALHREQPADRPRLHLGRPARATGLTMLHPCCQRCRSSSSSSGPTSCCGRCSARWRLYGWPRRASRRCAPPGAAPCATAPPSVRPRCWRCSCSSARSTACTSGARCRPRRARRPA